jgi:hypothetical protein
MKRLLVIFSILAASFAHAQILGPILMGRTAAGSVTLDNSCNSGNPPTSGSPATTTCTMTISASATKALVWAMIYGHNYTATGVTIGSCTATQATHVVESGGVNGETLELWECASPPSGSQTVTVTWCCGGLQAVTIAAESFIGATGFGTPVCAGTCGGTETTNGTALSLSVSSATGHLVADGAILDTGSNAYTLAASGSQALVGTWNNLWTSGKFDTSGSTLAGSSSVTMAWTASHSVYYLQIAVDVQ